MLVSVTVPESTYALTALAEGIVVSSAATVLRSVSNTPDFKFSTSMLLIVLPSASIVLLVRVSVPVNDAKVASDTAVLNSANVPDKVLSVRSIVLFVSVWLLSVSTKVLLLGIVVPSSVVVLSEVRVVKAPVDGVEDPTALLSRVEDSMVLF